MSYTAPLKDMLFNIEHLARIDQVAQMPGFEDAGLETAQAVLEEGARRALRSAPRQTLCTSSGTAVNRSASRP